jgi:hypothetical protein
MAKRKKPSNLTSLFGFVIRTRQYLVGRDNLKRNKRKLLFILITEDLATNGLKFVKDNFEDLPVVQKFSMSELEEQFNLNGVKIIGFYKTDLTRSIYEALKDWRMNG